MSRYLFGGLLLLIAALTLYSLGNSTDLVERIDRGTRASRDAISATPASAQNLSPVEQAGQNVTRQTSADGIAQAQQGTPAQAQTTTTQDTTTQAQNPAPAQTAAPAPRNSEAIPALW